MLLETIEIILVNKGLFCCERAHPISKHISKQSVQCVDLIENKYSMREYVGFQISELKY